MLVIEAGHGTPEFGVCPARFQSCSELTFPCIYPPLCFGMGIYSVPLHVGELKSKLYGVHSYGVGCLSIRRDLVIYLVTDYGGITLYIMKAISL